MTMTLLNVILLGSLLQTSVVSDNTNMLSFAWLYINACHCVQFLKNFVSPKLVFMRRGPC